MRNHFMEEYRGNANKKLRGWPDAFQPLCFLTGFAAQCKVLRNCSEIHANRK